MLQFVFMHLNGIYHGECLFGGILKEDYDDESVAGMFNNICLFKEWSKLTYATTLYTNPVLERKKNCGWNVEWIMYLQLPVIPKI